MLRNVGLKETIVINLFVLFPEHETFEKCSISFKIKKDKNFNHINSLSISRINPPKIGGGLKFESDAKIG